MALAPHPDNGVASYGDGRMEEMRGVWWLVTSVALAALMTGCNGEATAPRTEPARSTSASASASSAPASASSPSLVPAFQSAAASAAQEDIARAQRAARVAAFMAKTRPVEGGVVGAGFALEGVQYTSRTDAVADFYDCRTSLKRVCTTAIATTQDNWGHATGLAIPDTLADYITYMALGRGAVAIKAEGQQPYPPFVLYPDGKAMPLQVTHEARALDAGNHLVDVYDNGDFSDDVGADDAGPWAADIDAGEIFPVLGGPGGRLWELVPGRSGALLIVSGYHQDVGDGVWRFAKTNDNAGKWRQTDVRLPLGGKPLRRYAYVGDYRDAVGPGHLQAIAMADAPQDLPLFLRQLWRTDDEKAFRRVSLPRKRMAFGGMAFASDGALLLAEVSGPATYCRSLNCNRAGRIWRLPSDKSDIKPLAHAPRLSGLIGTDTLVNPGGGVIVARTGQRTIALSHDGYTWTNVTPGR